MTPSVDVRSQIRAHPSEATLAWAASEVGGGARVDSFMILEGGGACAIHAVDILDARGVRHPLVLKRFFRPEWLAREPDLAQREARILRALEAVDLPIPRVVGVDADGTACDCPAVLMTRLPGRVDLAPEDEDAWLRGLVEPLPYLHGADSAVRDAAPAYWTYNDVVDFDVPPWTREPAAWQRVLEVAARPPPPFTDRFLHRDYHPTNLLWTQGRVTGVLDWTSASHGPAAIDLCHCRANLVKLYGLPMADRFLAMHESLAPGTADYDPYWDCVTLLEQLPEPGVYWGWRNLGINGLTEAIVRGRLDTWAVAAAARA